MSAEFKTAVCTDYESLLVACQIALKAWRERREEIARLGPRRKEEGEQLLRLQADYAKKYSRLKRHQDTCETCCFVSKIGKQNFSSISMLQ
jgi:hypothetical protein